MGLVCLIVTHFTALFLLMLQAHTLRTYRVCPARVLQQQRQRLGAGGGVPTQATRRTLNQPPELLTGVCTYAPQQTTPANCQSSYSTHKWESNFLRNNRSYSLGPKGRQGGSDPALVTNNTKLARLLACSTTAPSALESIASSRVGSCRPGYNMREWDGTASLNAPSLLRRLRCGHTACTQL